MSPSDQPVQTEQAPVGRSGIAGWLMFDWASQPVHTLIIPKKHIANLAEVEEEDRELLGHLFLTVRKVAELKGVAEAGFRVISNIRNHGGQEVFHLHIHVIGGRPLGRMLLGS